MRQDAVKGSSEELKGNKEAFNDDGKASKGNWETFKIMKKR